jgi:hypothetical protein
MKKIIAALLLVSCVGVAVVAQERGARPGCGGTAEGARRTPVG